MKRTAIISVFILLLAAIMILVALKVPIPLATNSDFKVIYYTDQGLTRGINVYDHAAKIRMINDVYNVNINENFMPQFAYPPWYALSTFYLGLLPIQQAAVLWFEINLVMLFLSVWFLTDGWKPLYRLLAFPAALFFYPVLGTLQIGQYDFPILLGISMLIYAIRHKNAVLTAVGMALLTFKPHLGGLILIAGLIYLVNVVLNEAKNLSHFNGDPSVAKRSLVYTAVSGILLFVISFLADSSWLRSYLGSLFSYRDLGHITTCSECVNISVWLSRTISGELSLSQAGAIAVVILTALLALLFFLRRGVLKSPTLLLTSALMVTILASPYLYNYDFLLLLVPFALLTESNFERLVVAVCYLGSTFVLILFGRDGNAILLIVSLVMAVLLYLRIKSQVDVPASETYNVNN
jgi:hypothetical protein